ncbi:MAG: hypothetical protein QGH60_05995 [Phycisphaerae bacterium]|jgi:hypothetical protein|nr:hypothetical protein [Phycisphaerae bacterium]
MAKKRIERTSKNRALAKKANRPTAKRRKVEEVSEACSKLEDVLNDMDLGAHRMGMEICNIALEHPEAIAALTATMSRSGYTVAHLANNGSASAKYMAKVILLYRQRIIDELELDTAAELMLLDAAMDAYMHWLELTTLARATVKHGSNGENIKHQAKLVAMAQGYLKIYMEAMAALTEMKCPPIRILQVQAGENVAIQINEQTKVLEAKHDPQLCSPDKRKKLLESTPANQGEADEDSD